MSTREAKYVLLNLMKKKLRKHTLTSNEQRAIIEIYNSLDTRALKSYKASEVINLVAAIYNKQNNIINRNNFKPNKQIPLNQVNNKQMNAPINKQVGRDVNNRQMGRDVNRRVNRRVNNKQMGRDVNNKQVNRQVNNREIGNRQTDAVDQIQDIDMRDTMKDMLGITNNKQKEIKIETEDIEIKSILGVNDISTLQFLFNPSSLYTHYYIVLDTNFRLTDNDNDTTINKFRWNYAATQNLRTGFANTVGRVRDIIGIRMYQPRVHYLAAMDNTAKRISVLIEEFSSQAFIGENGRRFHFLFRPVLEPVSYTPAETQIELTTEDYNDGIFNFRKPITTFDSITLSFGDPLVLLDFPLTPTPFERMQFAIEFTCYKSDK